MHFYAHGQSVYGAREQDVFGTQDNMYLVDTDKMFLVDMNSLHLIVRQSVFVANRQSVCDARRLWSQTSRFIQDSPSSQHPPPPFPTPNRLISPESLNDPVYRP